MIKKFLLVCAIVLGAIYGSGSDLGSIKRSITGAANDQARGMTANSNDGWSDASGY